MSKKLTPRKLDIIVTKITPKHVYYELSSGRQSESWRIPECSVFDVSQLEIGIRYEVNSKVVRDKRYNHLTGKTEMTDAYDWTTVQVKRPKERLVNRIQSQASKAAAVMQVVGKGDLFDW